VFCAERDAAPFPLGQKAEVRKRRCQAHVSLTRNTHPYVQKLKKRLDKDEKTDKNCLFGMIVLSLHQISGTVGSRPAIPLLKP